MTRQRYGAHTFCFFARFLHIAIGNLLTEKVMYIKIVKEQKPFPRFFLQEQELCLSIILKVADLETVLVGSFMSV
jgi:hypothetical protein